MANFMTILARSANHWLYSTVKSHRAFLNQQIDPIQTVTSIAEIRQSSGKASNFHLYFALLIVVCIPVYGTFGFHYEATKDASLESLFNLKALRSSPFIFSHQVCPKSIRAQIDFGLWTDIIASVAIYLTLIITDAVNGKSKIFQLDNTILFGFKALTEEESKKIILIHRRIKRLFQYGINVFVFCLVAFFLVNLWINSVYSRTFLSFCYWLILFPMFVFYLVYALFGLLIYIILSSRYLRIRQQTLVTRFEQINANLSKVKQRQPNLSMIFPHCWRLYFLVNLDSVHLCTIIGGQVRFCAPLLSVIFPYYISVQCYLIYIVLYIEIPFVQMQIFYLAVFEINAFLFLIIHECSHVAKRGRKLEVLNGKFCFLFTRKGGNDFVDKARLVKVETFQTARRLHPFAFMLFGNYRITSKTYHVIISYISAYFMFVFKKL